MMDTRRTAWLIRSLALLLLAGAATAQGSNSRRELDAKLKAAGSDVAALLETAEWAKEQGLVTDHRRILQKVLQIDPQNATAHELLGFVKVNGEWMTRSKAELALRKAFDAEMKAKGMVEVDGVWVTKEEEKDAKKGIFWHEGERVSRTDKMALVAGKVRHPVTGEFIAAEDASKAEAGLFPGPDGQWFDKDAADRYHSNRQTPWVLRTYSTTLVSTRPIDELRELGHAVDSGHDFAGRIFGGEAPSPDNRTVILICTDSDHYRQMGDAVGGEDSAYAVFVADATAEVAGVGTVRPVITNWDKDWGPYWVRHAAGLGYASNLLSEIGAEAPLWFLRGIGGLAERHYSPGVAAWFGKQHLEKGGIKDLADWFANFKISGELSSSELDYQVYQAGLVLAFAMEQAGPAQDALQKVTAAVQERSGAKVTRAIRDLEKALVESEEQIRTYLADVTRRG